MYIVQINAFMLVLVLLIAIQFLSAALGLTSITPQKDLLVPFNSDDNITLYDCETDETNISDNLYWQIICPGNIALQATALKNMSADEHGIIVEDDINCAQLNCTRSQLNFNITRFRESEISNSTIIVQCRIIGGSDSSIRSIHIYGPLNRPSNLEVTEVPNSERTFKLSWTGTDVPPGVELFNYVEVTGLSSNDSQPLVENSTHRDYFTFNYSEECNLFSFSVFSSSHGLPNSDVATMNQTLPISPDVSSISRTLSTTVELQTTGASFNITFRPATVCMANITIENHTVILEDKYDLSMGYVEDDSQIQVVINDSVIPGLSRDQAINYYIEACSSITCRSTSTFTTYTTGVQMPVVYYYSTLRYILVTCNFAEGSTTSGCTFNFSSSGIERNETYIVLRNSTVNSSLCHGTGDSDSSQACMCLEILSVVTDYAAIQVFTVEEDDSNNNISVLANLMELNQESLSVCNPVEPPTEPMQPSTDRTPTIGIALGIGLGVPVVFGVIVVICITVVVLLYKRKIRLEAEKSRKLNATDHEITLDADMQGHQIEGETTFQTMPEADGESSDDSKFVEMTLELKVKVYPTKKEGVPIWRIVCSKNEINDKLQEVPLLMAADTRDGDQAT